MAINDNTKLDVLWKKVVFGTTETSEIKAGPNESVSSPFTVYNDDIYSQSGQIPKPAPSTSNSIVHVYSGSERIQCIVDNSVAGNKTWFAVSNPNESRNYEISPGVSNALIDWIAPSFDSSYLLKVYAGDPQTTGVMLNPLTTNNEWLFDYKAGTLYFPNNVPSSVISNGIYIEGYRYVGLKGVASEGELSIQTFQYTTNTLAYNESEEFDLNTGKFCTVLDLNVSSPSLIKAHSVSTRDDTNPYTFRGVDGHLYDDGSFLQGGTRFYGQRYAFLASKESSNNTYWAITNEKNENLEITINITISKL